MNGIEIRSLSKAYGEKRAVDGLTLDIREGELFALLGVNGAGKSTAIRMLCGILKPDSGDACLLGNSIVHAPDKARAICGISPQETALAPRLSVYENLELMARIYGVRNAKERVEQMIESCGFAPMRRVSAGKLSGGWQRRLSIAMAMIAQPKILFLDEPTLGLDILARHELWRELKTLRGKTTILLTTHYLEEAQALADRIGVMRSGRLKAVGTASELMAQSGCDSFEEAFIALAAGGAE